ncbi:MAG: hypothetical protein ACN4EP_00815 [Sediminibacterium sp.]
MKLFAMGVMIMLSLIASAQSISLMAGRMFTPTDVLSLRYTHYSNNPFRLSLSASLEKGIKHRLSYGSFGSDLSINYDPSISSYPDKRGGLAGAVGFCWQVEHEPWLYKDWSFAERSSFGLSSEISYNYYLSGAFRLGIFGQQKMLFNPRLGRYRCGIGLSLSHVLGN